MNRLLLGTTALALVMIAMPADALSSCRVTTSPTLAMSSVGGLTVYVAKDPCNIDCAFTTYVYLESNGIPGLQRSDDRRDDTCGGSFMGDTQVY